MYGDGQQVRDWLYVEDHCSAIETVLANGTLGETYNVGGNNQQTNITVVKTICALLDELKPKANRRTLTRSRTCRIGRVTTAGTRLTRGRFSVSWSGFPRRGL